MKTKSNFRGGSATSLENQVRTENDVNRKLLINQRAKEGGKEETVDKGLKEMRVDVKEKYLFKNREMGGRRNSNYINENY